MFSNEHYVQVDAVAIGFTLGPSVGNVFLDHPWKQWLSGNCHNICPNIHKRLADDIFVTFDSHDQPKEFVKHMNNE